MAAEQPPQLSLNSYHWFVWLLDAETATYTEEWTQKESKEKVRTMDFRVVPHFVWTDLSGDKNGCKLE